MKTQGRQPCEDRGGDWNYFTTSQWKSGAGSWKKQKAKKDPLIEATEQE